MKKEFNNTTKYFRAIHDSEHTYTPISNALINDDRLNFYEKGLMTWILSNSDIYVLNIGYAKTISGFGKKTLDKASMKLQELGYLKKERNKGGWHWTINESPNIRVVEQGSNSNIHKSTLKNEGPDVSANKPMIENEHIISNKETSNNEINTEEETSIYGINQYPNSANLNNDNCHSKGEILDNKLDVVNDNVFDSRASSSIQKETESKDDSYNSIKIQNEINAYDPVYFKDSNGFVGAIYNEFVKETKIDISIQKFEKVLLMEIHNEYVLTNPSKCEFSVENLKQYLLKHNPTITSSNIQNMLDVMKNTKNTDTITNIIENYNSNM